MKAPGELGSVVADGRCDAQAWLVEPDRVALAGGDGGAPGGNRDVGADAADAAVQHDDLHRAGAVEGVNGEEVLLLADEPALRRMKRLGSVIEAAVVEPPLAVSVIRR